MSRITKLINNIRLELGDSNTTRYDNDLLIEHINNGIIDFVLATKCLKERLYMGLGTASAIYDLREYILEVERVEYLNKNIEALSFTELDAIDPEWQLTTGDKVLYVTFDHLAKGLIRVYPRVAGAINNIEQNNLYGGLIDITINDDIYQIPSINDVEQNIEQYLVLYCVKKPKKVTLTTPDNELELNSIFDKALLHYVKAQCLRSDTDAINRQYGNEELQLYSNYLTKSKVDSAIANNKVNNRVVRYGGAFE